MPSCQTLTIRNQGHLKDGLYKISDEKLKHVPVYKSFDQDWVLYYKRKDSCWTLIHRSQWDDVNSGVMEFHTDCFSKDDAEHIQCGVHDADLIGNYAAYNIDCSYVRPGQEVYTNLKCDS